MSASLVNVHRYEALEATVNPESHDGRSPGAKTSQRRRGVHPLVHLLIAMLVLALLQGFVVKLYAIPSASMEPTMEVGDRILVNRLAYVSHGPQVGDVIVFSASEEWGPSPAEHDSAIEYGLKWVGSILGLGPGVENILTKRVVAVGGQTIECCSPAGDILVDGKPLPPPSGPDLPFSPGVTDCNDETAERCFPPLLVPAGTVVVAGDNRANSHDSLTNCRTPGAEASCLLTVDVEDVIGAVFFTVAPLQRFGYL